MQGLEEEIVATVALDVLRGPGVHAQPLHAAPRRQGGFLVPCMLHA